MAAITPKGNHMKLNDFLKRSVTYYRSHVNGGSSVCLRGAIGRGKTTIMRKVPARLSAALGGTFGMVLLSGPLLNPTDALGFLMPQTTERLDREGVVRKHLESLFSEPFFFRTDEGRHVSEYDGGIIFVDEEDKMDPDVKKIIGEAALSGRLGPHTLPKGWVVWFAGNRQADRSGSTKDYAHLQNRRRDIEIDDDIDGLVDHYTREGINPVFVSFAATNPQVVHEDIPGDIKAWCTPRSLEACARYVMQYMQDNGIDPMSEEIPIDPLMSEDIAGNIGVSAGHHLAATIQLGREMPKFPDIVANPKKVPVPNAPDAQMLVCYTLAARVDEKTVGPVIEYIERFPQEFTITFGKAAVAKNFKLVNHPAFGKWTQKNSSLMMAITDLRQ